MTAERDAFNECPTCGGEGHRYLERTGRNANHPIAEIPCARCAGTGLIESEPCNECGRPVEPDDAAPSCGAHVLHIGCAQWFSCRECYRVRTEDVA